MAEPMFFSDGAPLDGVRKTDAGFLVAQVRAGRTGIQQYLGSELGRTDMEVVRVYRPEDEVFSAAAMHTAAHRTVTIGHPPEFVTADTWKDVSVGHTGGEVMRDGGFITVPLVLMDGAAVKAVEDGKRELSWGYACDIDWQSGKTPDGQEYDAIQRNIRINHLAVVDRGRAGAECRIGDAARRIAGDSAVTPTPTPPPTPPTKFGGRSMADESTRAIVIDGLTVRTNDAGAEAIGKLQQALRDAAATTASVETRLRDAETAHRAALEAKDGQIAALSAQVTKVTETKDGEIAALTAAHTAALAAKDGEIAALQAATSDAALDARVTARSNLLAQVAPILGAGFNPAGMSDAAIRKAVVVKVMGDALPDADSKSDAFFDGAFIASLAMAARGQAPAQAAPPVDPLRVAITNGGGTPVGDQRANVTPFQANVERLRNAWKHTNPAEAV